MAAMEPGARGEEDEACTSPAGPAGGRRPREQLQESLVYMQCCGQERAAHGKLDSTGPPDHQQGPLYLPQRRPEVGWTDPRARMRTTNPTMPSCPVPVSVNVPYSFRSPESVEMDEIMAAMVLTSLSGSPVVQSTSQTDPAPGPAGSSGDMECTGGELSDSGSSGYWSWDHGSVSPAPSPCVAEADSSPDEGLHMELEPWDELNDKRSKRSFKGAYRCLWPGCGAVLTSSVGMKRHVRVLHLGCGSEHSLREEDFYYTKISGEVAGEPSLNQNQAQNQAQNQNQNQAQTAPHAPWPPCGSLPSSDLQIPPCPRPRSNSGPVLPSLLSQSAPSSFWQIHTEHLYQACAPVLAPRSPTAPCWTPPLPVSSHQNTQMVRPRCRSVSAGEQWLQQNSAASRLQTATASPSRAHCSFRKGRGEAKKCRKVYGVERKDQWCTACRWKKACQRFPD